MSVLAPTASRRALRAARKAARQPVVALAPVQILWLGAMILAVQLPHLLSLPKWVTLIGATLVGLRLLLVHRDRSRPAQAPTRIPTWVLALCAAAAAGAIRLSFGNLIGREPCVAFLFILVGIKFLEARTLRDGGLLVCLASFLAVTPFFYSQSPLAAVAAAPGLLLIGAVLDVLARPPLPGTAARNWRAPVGRAGRLLLQGIPLAALLFVLFPRLSAPLWGLPVDHSARTGLSDSMAPGMISDLSQSDAIAFRVDFEDRVPAPAQRYWRGPVLSRFDGREWTMQLQRLDGQLVRPTRAPIDYTVTLEPHSKPWLFALDLPTSLPAVELERDANGAQRFSEVALLSRNQQLISRNMVTQPLRYHQRSVLRDRYPADYASDAADNLRLPQNRNFSNPRTIELARELRARHPDDIDYIRAVLAWFTRESFVYTLAPPLLDRDPVDGFLFATRAGFCEHYASAFAVLLRAAGIPARIVTGYQGGEMNPRGNYMIVRQSDAHAWVEALLDGEWRRFDPTGAISPSRIESGLGGALPNSSDVPILARLDVGWIKGFQLAWDAINYDWRRNVIGFNYERQRSFWREWKVDRFGTWQYALLIGGCALAWVGLVLGWLMWRRARQDPAWTRWEALCRRLARAGLPRLPHEGPLTYAARAAGRWPEFRAAFGLIGDTYAALRYGPTPAGADRERSAALAQLEGAIRALPRPAALRARGAV